MDDIFIVIDISEWDELEHVIGVSHSMDIGVFIGKTKAGGERFRLERWSLGDNSERLESMYFYKDGIQWYRKEYV